MTNIHPLAVVDSHAQIGNDVEIGPFCVVGPNVILGDGCRLMSHVVLDGYTTIGERNTFYPYSSAGLFAQHKRSNAPDATLTIGDDNTFREHTTLHVGSDVDQKKTIVGSRNLMLVGSHVAHDCILGNDIVMSNNVMLAGHVIVEDRATIGGGSAVAQFTRIGKGSFIGGMCGVAQDLIPYGIVVGGSRVGLGGLNLIGLRRAQIPSQLIFDLQKAYSELFLNKEHNLKERIDLVEQNPNYANNPLIQDVVRFMKNPSKNNILQPEG